MQFSCTIPKGSIRFRWHINSTAWTSESTPELPAGIVARRLSGNNIRFDQITNYTVIFCSVVVNDKRYEDVRKTLKSKKVKIIIKGTYCNYSLSNS